MTEGNLFDVAAGAYDRLMGRYLPTLGPVFADTAGVAPGMRALDVGCGPGGLTTVLVERLGADHVAAVDPSPPFVEACRSRHPGVDVREGVAEHLPFDDDTFDAALASLVVGFMSDPVAGVTEMLRVTRPGGRVALSFWDFGRMPLLSIFWRAAKEVDPAEPGEQSRVGRRQGDLAALLREAGAADVVETSLPTTATYADLDDWWSSFTGGAGPVGAYARALPPEQAARVREHADALLGSPRRPFTLEAFVWCGVGTS